MKKPIGQTSQIIKLIVFTLLVFTVLYSQVLSLIRIDQSSMEDTLIKGQVMVLEKLSYRFGEPRRGDIVIFLRNDSAEGIINKFSIFFNDVKLKLSGKSRSDRLIKRVVALAGDEIDIQNGKVIINGVEQEEIYAKTATDEKTVKMPMVVPDDSVFVMGDNRDVSTDSRTFGPVAINRIEGKIILRAAQISEFGKP